MCAALTRWGAAAAAVVVLVALLPVDTIAHTGQQSYLYLDVTPDRLSGRVELPYGDLRKVFGLTLKDDDDAATLQELRSREAELFDYLRRHVSIGAAGAAWELDFTEIDLLVVEGGYAVMRFQARVPGTEVPRTLDVRLDPFFDAVPNRDALLLIGNDWQGGVIDNGERVFVGFDPGTRTRRIELGAPSQWRNFVASVWMGVDHIRTGPDHILFVLSLLLPSVLVFVGAWRPVSTFSRSLWRILAIVTMFTAAHSITFLLAGLQWLPLPPSWLVESVIAASIAATALHNLRPIAVNREASIAFVFGLFHGMGFASLVGGLDVSQTTRLISLLGRNVGIEIGQAVVVLLAFPALFVLRRTIWYRPVFVVASIVLAGISCGWMVERLFDLDLNVARVVEPFIRLPRAFVLVLIGMVIAAAIHRYEHKAGRLLPTTDTLSRGRSARPPMGHGNAVG